MKKPAVVAAPVLPALPSGILQTDLKAPSWRSGANPLVEDYKMQSFEMWYTERFEWVIPTLRISGRPTTSTERTYATTIDGRLCRVGNGPHVKHKVTVYVRKTRLEALRKFLDIRSKGDEAAHDRRDDLSTRRLRHRRISYDIFR